MKDHASILKGEARSTQGFISSGKKGKTMRNLYRYLAVAVLTIVTAACQTDAVHSNVPPQPPASLLNVRPPQLTSSDDESQTAATAELVPQQYGCAWQGQDDYYGYTICLEHNTSFWWLIWPHGHGFDSCYYAIWMESNGGYFTPLQVSQSYEVCN